MYQFTVPEMTCDGCAKAVTRALQSVDPQGTVQADLHRREVTISSSASKQVLLSTKRAIRPSPALFTSADGTQ